MQNKPYFFFLETGVPKRGGGGSDIWEKFPKNPVFFGRGVGWRPLSLRDLGAKNEGPRSK